MENSNAFDLQFRSQITDLKRRKKFVKNELNQTVLKAMLEINLNCNKFSSKNRFKTLSIAENIKKTKQNTYTRIRNRCVLTGRNSTLKKFRLSRIIFRKQAGLGQLPGVSKRLNK
jgi:ribosomal protein S14